MRMESCGERSRRGWQRCVRGRRESNIADVDAAAEQKVDEMFKMAIPNLRVNGFDYEHYLASESGFAVLLPSSC